MNVNVVNAYKSKKLQRNVVKQKIDWKNHKIYRLRFSFFATFPPIPRHENSLKTCEDSSKTPSVVTWFAGVYPCVSTEDPEGQKCYFSISISNKYTMNESLSKYCLESSFALIACTLVLPPNTLKTYLHYMLCGYKKESGRTFWVFRTMISGHIWTEVGGIVVLKRYVPTFILKD